nr:hypothetical protein [uncultured Caproiciproducens sp.]
MTWVKRRGMVLLIEDSTVSKYTGDGFSVLGKPEETDPVISDLISRAEKLKLKLPDGLTVEQVRTAVEEAETAKAGGTDGSASK